MNFFKKLFGKEDIKDDQRPAQAHGAAPQKTPARLADAKAWNVGDTILGEYKVVGLLGEGGMGQVYLAREPLTDTQVAIKIMKPQLAVDPQAVPVRERQTG